MKVSMSKAAATLVVGLNPALQKRFVLQDRLVPGQVHRARDIQIGIGGKGQDVAVALSCLAYDGNQQVVQFLGAGGQPLWEAMEERLGGSEPLERLTIRTASPLRTCTSLVGTDTTTELVEPSGEVTAAELETFWATLEQETAERPVGAICFMGSLPPGCPTDTYAQMYQRVTQSSGTLCVIDSVVGLDALLGQIRDLNAPRGPALLKINVAELCQLAGVTHPSDGGAIDPETLVEAVTTFLARYSAALALRAVALTDGPHPAYAAILPVSVEESEFRLFQVPIASLESGRQDSLERTTSSSSWWPSSSAASSTFAQTRPLYPIGAGDAVAAGTLAAWRALTADDPNGSSILPDNLWQLLEGSTGRPTRAILTAFSFGLACGSASCWQEENSVLDQFDVSQLYQKAARPVFLSSHKLPAASVKIAR
jgi:fructose-1-phosphate kinase PfkB-like protein